MEISCRVVRVLCIDGGGIRGLIPALVLAELEERTGKRVIEMFDFVAGTSTGGILTCALTMPGPGGGPRYSARQLVSLYESEGPHIFSRSLLKRIFSLDALIDERYEDDGLNGALEGYLDSAHLREALVPIMVTAYDIQDRFAFFFRSARAVDDPTYDFALWEVARATSAAPTYFEPYEITDAAGDRTYPLVDGGVFAINPAACALVDVGVGEIDLLASLGTGSYTRAYAFSDARWWGQLGWARPVLDMVFDGQAETTEFICSRLLGDRYLRLQTALDDASDDLDDASPENLERLRAAAAEVIAGPEFAQLLAAVR